MDSDSYQPPIQNLPALWQVGLFLVVAAGLTAWAVGRLAAKGVCVVSGIVLGGIAALIARQHFGLGGAAVWYILGGAVAAGVLSWLLFRLWVGITGAVLLAIVGPGVYLIATDIPLPLEPHRDTAQLVDTLSSCTPANSGQSCQEFFERQNRKTTKWWADRTAAERNLLLMLAAAAALTGLVAGLVGPHVTSSFISSLVGGCLAVMSLLLLFDVYLPSAARWMSSSPTVGLITLGLITSAGMAIQWMISRRKTDND